MTDTRRARTTTTVRARPDKPGGQPKLGARVRLLAAGDVNKNDPNDARSVAVAALRSAGVREVRPVDHAAVLKACVRAVP